MTGRQEVLFFKHRILGRGRDTALVRYDLVVEHLGKGLVQAVRSS